MLKAATQKHGSMVRDELIAYARLTTSASTVTMKMILILSNNNLGGNVTRSMTQACIEFKIQLIS